MANGRVNWEKIGNEFYRKIPIYNDIFDSDLDLSQYNIVAAPFGGALALWRDTTKTALYRNQATRSGVDIYSSAGRFISHINWDTSKNPIRGLGWSEDEQLLVVAEDGTFHVYTGLFGDFQPYSLGHRAEDHGVISCRFWSHGFVALLGNNTLVSVSSFDEPRPRLLAEFPTGPNGVSAWAIIPPQYTLARTVEVLVATDKTIFVVDVNETEDRGLTEGPFKHITISPNGEYVSLYVESGKMWVVGSNFQNKYSEYDSKIKTAPRNVLWCGNDAVVLAWEDELHVVGPDGVANKYYFDDIVHALPDIDGVRLITSQSVEFLQKVPDESEEIFKLGSNSSASVLFDSIDLLERQSPKADENVQRIKSGLPEAVESCVRAAGQEFDHALQKQLLRAASFGKSVLELYDSDEFVEMCENLRVLNAVREHSIGLPLTLIQYNYLRADRLITRLIHRREYLLAIKLSEFLHLPLNKVYVHWASQKVKSNGSNDELTKDVIVERLRGKHGISFEAIARAAYGEGRRPLATSLLNYEPRAGKQVPLLLNMEEDDLALDKAIESGDSDLIFYVLLHLRGKLPLSTFFRTVSSRPQAAALLESSARVQDRELLKDLYYQDDRPIAGSNLLFEDAMMQTAIPATIDKLKLASRLLTDVRDPGATAQTRALTEASTLLKMQELFDKDLASEQGSTISSYIGLSVNQTLFNLLRSGQAKRASRVQSEFKVPEKTYAWIRLRALVSARNWPEVEEMGKARKSPIGWEPFYTEIFEAGNLRLAGSFVGKCSNRTSTERIDMWVKCGMIVRAAEEAVRTKEWDALEDLRARAKGADVAEVERLVSQTRKR